MYRISLSYSVSQPGKDTLWDKPHCALDFNHTQYYYKPFQEVLFYPDFNFFVIVFVCLFFRVFFKAVSIFPVGTKQLDFAGTGIKAKALKLNYKLGSRSL